MAKNTMKLLVPLATAGLAAVVTIGSGATWTSTTGPKTMTVTAGKILTTLDDGNVTLDISGLQPGQSSTGTVWITNDDDHETNNNAGILDGKLAFTESPVTFDPTALALPPTDTTHSSDPASYMHLKIERWDPSANGGTGGWTTIQTDAFANQAADNPVEAALPYDAGKTIEYQFTASIDAGTPNELQGQQATMDFTWTATPKLGSDNTTPTDQSTHWADPTVTPNP